MTAPRRRAGRAPPYPQRGRRGRGRGLIRALLALIVLAACAGAPAPTEPAKAPPNILLITAEDLSPRLGAYGDPVARTPNLDRLAADGVTFTRAFATAGVCAPSRSSLITGVHQQTLGTMHMRTSSYGKGMEEGVPYEAVPPPEVKAFPELLRRLGYFAANDAKTDFQFGMPFTVWDETRQGADWRGRQDGQPFFVMVNFNQTHESYTFGLDGLNEGARARNARLDARKAHRTDPADVTVPPY